MVVNLLCVVFKLFANGQNSDLFRRKPQGEIAGEVFDEDANKSFHRSKWCAVDHYRTMRLIVCPGVVQPKPFRQVVVDLHGAKLPFAADDIFYLDGGGKVRIWISRKLDLIVLRMGYPPPRGLGFDESFLPNTIIRGIM